MGHTVGEQEIMDMVVDERRSAVVVALAVIGPVFALPPLYLLLVRAEVEIPPVVPWLVLGPGILGALALVAVVHDRRVTARERRRSARFADEVR